MKKKSLFKKVESLGYPLFETDERFDANETLAEVVKSKDLRLWEGFPVLLANSFEKGFFNQKAVEMRLKTAFDKTYFHKLVLMSLALYDYLRLDFPWMDELRQSPFFNQKMFNEFLKQFSDSRGLTGVKNLSASRLVNSFKRYFTKRTIELEGYSKMKNEFDLEYSLSQLLSKKQKELFMKKLKGAKMTKTEREYYSRSVRKKVFALANPTLHELALKIAKK